MRPLRYSVNVTVDGCCDHAAVIPDEEMHQCRTGTIAKADALLLGRVTCRMMEEAWRQAPKALPATSDDVCEADHRMRRRDS